MNNRLGAHPASPVRAFGKGRLYMSRKLMFVAVTALLLTGCATSGYQRSTVIERPEAPIKSMLILVEAPAFSPISSEKDGVLKVHNGQNAALKRYQVGFYAAVRRDMSRVMNDNGISSKLVFIPPVFPIVDGPLKRVKEEEKHQWKYALWLRHTRGMSLCRYTCEAYFQTEVKLLNNDSGKIIWSTVDDTYAGELVWRDGRMYKSLLSRLGADGMISLPNSEPVINIQTITKGAGGS